jgi:hypothetical protein
LFLAISAAQANESDLALRAYHLGKTLGEALHCDEPAAGHFGVLAGTWLRGQARSPAHWHEALGVFATAARVLTETGPVNSSCEHWRPGYEARYQRLRQLARR